VLDDTVHLLQNLQPVVYGIVALAGLWRWWILRTAVAAYGALSFVVLAAVVIVGRFLPADPSQWDLLRRAVVAVLVLFPFLLFRFAGSFAPAPATFEVLGAGLTVAAVVGIFAVGDMPAESSAPSDAFFAYSVLILVQWLFLSSYVTWTLWRGGQGRPSVTRRRMRVLALGAAGMALAIVLAVANQGEGPVSAVQLIVALLAIGTAPLFLVGVAPPRLLLASWRRPDELALREAEIGLVAATTPAEVGAALLPHVARTAGAVAALLVSPDAEVIASYGLGTAEAERVAESIGSADPNPTIVAAPLRSGWLAVVTDAYSPYFGREESEVLGRVGTMTDLALRRAHLVEAERVAARDLEKANSAMRQFVAVASHDLRTPIAIIRGFCSSVMESWPEVSDEEKKGIFETVDRQASHLSRIVNDLMMISRIDSGVIASDLAPIALDPVINGVLLDMRHGEDAVVQVGDLEVLADEDHLVRIVRNLVENAFHYGRPPLDITATPDGPDAVVLHFRDHGNGVGKDFEQRLFERFARAESAASISKVGTGLGLSIVRGLAQAGGGDAWYEAVDNGTGACFAVRLPTPSRS
jgi:signal transduction histidine kinase